MESVTNNILYKCGVIEEELEVTLESIVSKDLLHTIADEIMYIGSYINEFKEEFNDYRYN